MSQKFLVLELFILFIFIPSSLALNYSEKLKVALVLGAFIYICGHLIKSFRSQEFLKPKLKWKSFFVRIGIQTVILGIVTVLAVYLTHPEALFCIPTQRPKLYVTIVLVYTFISVWPQEVIYRTFFFQRYQKVISSDRAMILVNALLFMFAHLFFRNVLVLILTFLGGILFALTYIKTKSILLVSIEHALYGNWLFTVGMGEMLAFPGQESCG